MIPATKTISIWAVVAALSGGSGVYAVDALLDMGDHRWVTIASQNVQIRFDIEDEITRIKRWIVNGTATPDDLIRKAVLEDRLRRLQADQ